MNRLTLIALGGLACMPASAGEVVLSWTNPVAYEDESPLAPADIVSYRIQWTGACPGFGFVDPANNIVTPGNATTHTLEVTPGNRCFRVAVSARDPATGSVAESAWSNVATATVVEPPRTPAAPSGLTVQESAQTAWTVVTTDGAIVALEVGTVPPGTECDSSQYVKPFGRDETLYRVSETAVAYLPGQTALVAFAACSGG